MKAIYDRERRIKDEDDEWWEMKEGYEERGDDKKTIRGLEEGGGGGCESRPSSIKLLSGPNDQWDGTYERKKLNAKEQNIKNNNNIMRMWALKKKLFYTRKKKIE